MSYPASVLRNALFGRDFRQSRLTDLSYAVNRLGPVLDPMTAAFIFDTMNSEMAKRKFFSAEDVGPFVSIASKLALHAKHADVREQAIDYLGAIALKAKGTASETVERRIRRLNHTWLHRSRHAVPGAMQTSERLKQIVIPCTNEVKLIRPRHFAGPHSSTMRYRR